MEELIPFGTRPSQARFTQNSWLFLRSFLILYRFQGSLLSSELVHNTTCSLFCQHFFWSFFTFFASFLKTLIFQWVQASFTALFLLTLSPFSYLSFPCLSFSSCSLSPFSFYSAHSVTLPFVVAVSTLFHRVLIFYCISISALLQYLSEAYTASKHCSQWCSFIIWSIRIPTLCRPS